MTDLLATKPRRPGREQDIHDLLEQFTAIADELNDNLDDYAPPTATCRKALPKLLAATERWSNSPQAPPPKTSPTAYPASLRSRPSATSAKRPLNLICWRSRKPGLPAAPPSKDQRGTYFLR